MILLSVFLCTTAVITDLSPKYIVATSSILVAIVVYYFIVYRRNHLKYMGMSALKFEVFLSSCVLLQIGRRSRYKTFCRWHHQTLNYFDAD